MSAPPPALPTALVGDDEPAPCLDGVARPLPRPRFGRLDQRAAHRGAGGGAVDLVDLEEVVWTDPGAVRASAGLSTSLADVDRLISVVEAIASGAPPPVAYHQDPGTGDYWPETDQPGWTAQGRAQGTPCARR